MPALRFFDFGKLPAHPFAMCNLYRMTRAVDEVAHLFDVELVAGGNAGEEVYPGYPGWVVGQNHMATMSWGFPRQMKGKSGQPIKPKAVNNARSDSLGEWFWRDSDEWGRVYSMVITEPNEAMSEVHNRMPVILQPISYASWLRGSPDQALELCRPYGGALSIDRTGEPWNH